MDPYSSPYIIPNNSLHNPFPPIPYYEPDSIVPFIVPSIVSLIVSLIVTLIEPAKEPHSLLRTRQFRHHLSFRFSCWIGG